MKDYWFKIKVSDLLLKPWSKDVIEFSNKFTKNIPNLTEEWISWTVSLMSLNENSIQVIIKNIKTRLNTKCDVCWVEFIKDIYIKSYDTKFVNPKIHHDLSEKDHDSEFLIDDDDNINIEDLLTQAILVQNMIVIRCDDCEEKLSQIDDDEDILDIPTTTKNIIDWK